jgi:hypothetical protein
MFIGLDFGMPPQGNAESLLGAGNVPTLNCDNYLQGMTEQLSNERN